MFSPAAQPIAPAQEPGLIALGDSMRDPKERAGKWTPRIGYTYFGQFIDHDITYDNTDIDGPYSDPEQTQNGRTAYLDLDSLYGGGPQVSGQLYEGAIGAETFKVGQTIPGGYLRDVPLINGQPVLPDPSDVRNFENLIVRQFHVLFLKFHNEAVKQLSAQPPTVVGETGPDNGTIFERARRLVRWHYQYIVHKEYLLAVLDGVVRKTLYAQRLPIRLENEFSIPIEFSAAAFRFGHSMVRGFYTLNCKKEDLALLDLVTKVPPGGSHLALKDEEIIQWGIFLDGLPASFRPTGSSFIDTALTLSLHKLPAAVFALFSKMGISRPDPRLPVRTLLRGARYKIASGQEVAEHLLTLGRIRPQDPLSSTELTQDSHDQSGSALKRANLQGNTPLFYYLLKEAEIKGNGQKLGPIASHIIGDVIIGALANDPDGYLRGVGSNWQLPVWNFPDEKKPHTVSSLADIVRLVGDSGLLLGCKSVFPTGLYKRWPQLGRAVAKAPRCFR
jgi:heme peroxidase